MNNTAEGLVQLESASQLVDFSKIPAGKPLYRPLLLITSRVLSTGEIVQDYCEAPSEAHAEVRVANLKRELERNGYEPKDFAFCDIFGNGAYIGSYRTTKFAKTTHPTALIYRQFDPLGKYAFSKNEALARIESARLVSRKIKDTLIVFAKYNGGVVYANSGFSTEKIEQFEASYD
ncbi:MAG: hypothetical protein WCO33_01425 [bacterium]